MNIKFENQLVAFIDILGFKDIITEYFNKTNSEKLNKIKDSIENAEKSSTKIQLFFR